MSSIIQKNNFSISFLFLNNRELLNRSKELKAKTLLLHELIQNAVANTSITAENVLDDELLPCWDDVQSDVLERGIKPAIIHLNSFQKQCEQLEKKINEIFEHQHIKFNSSKLNTFATEMKTLYPQYNSQMAELMKNGQFKMTYVLLAFRLALPAMLRSIETYKMQSLDTLRYESNYMDDLSSKANNILQRGLQLDVDTNDRNVHDVCDNKPLVRSVDVLENIHTLILSTPPVSYDATKRTEPSTSVAKRISLIEDLGNIRSIPMITGSARSTLKSSICSNRREKSNQCAQELFKAPSTLNPNTFTNKKLDPMSVLRKISQRDKTRSPKASKYMKQINFSHSNDNTTIRVPDFSSTLIHDNSRESSHNLSDQINISLAGALSTPTKTMANTTKIENQTSLINITNSHKIRTPLQQMRQNNKSNINLSPSGLLEPLDASITSDLSGIALLSGYANNSQDVNSVLFFTSFFIQFVIAISPLFPLISDKHSQYIECIGKVRRI